MAEKNKNNKDSQKGQVTPKKKFKKKFNYQISFNGQKNLCNKILVALKSWVYGQSVANK